MKMKSILIILIAILFIAGFSACSGKVEADSQITADTLDEMPFELSPQEVYEALQTGEVMVIDVREQWEYEEGHIPSAELIPMMEVENRLFEIPKDKHVIITCRSGSRSSQIAEFLKTKAYDKIHQMNGGFLAWKEAGLPVEE
jgi:rhodanese-related sulfurtransferase